MDINQLVDGYRALNLNVQEQELKKPIMDGSFCAFKQYSVLEVGDISYSDSTKTITKK